MKEEGSDSGLEKCKNILGLVPSKKMKQQATARLFFPKAEQPKWKQKKLSWSMVRVSLNLKIEEFIIVAQDWSLKTDVTEVDNQETMQSQAGGC